MRFFAALGNTKALCRPHKVMKVVGAGPFPFVLPAKERHPAPECGTTVWCVGAGIHGGSPSSYRRKVVVPHPDAGPVSTRLFVLPVKTGIHGGVTVGGCVPTSSRFLVQGAPSRPYPTMGTASECGTTVWCVRAGIHGDPSIRLTGENRYPWWGDSGGYALTPSRSVFEGAPSRPYPTMGTRIGVRYDCVVCRSRNTRWPPPRLTGERSSSRTPEPVSQIAWLNYFLSPGERIEVRAPRRTTVFVVSIEDSYDFTLHPNPLPQNGRGDY